jgi:hypothetical protein
VKVFFDGLRWRGALGGFCGYTVFIFTISDETLLKLNLLLMWLIGMAYMTFGMLVEAFFSKTPEENEPEDSEE